MNPPNHYYFCISRNVIISRNNVSKSKEVKAACLPVKDQLTGGPQRQSSLKRRGTHSKPGRTPVRNHLAQRALVRSGPSLRRGPAGGQCRACAAARPGTLPPGSLDSAPPFPCGFDRACGGPGEEAGHVGAAAAAAPPPVPAAAAVASWAESARGPGGARCSRPAGLLTASAAAAVAHPGCRPAAEMATRSCREKAQKLNEQHQLILSKLLREEDNKYCADCEAKGSAGVVAARLGASRGR